MPTWGARSAGRWHSALLTFNTARFLRPAQLASRASFMAERWLAARRPALLPRLYAERLANLQTVTRDAVGPWTWPPGPFEPAARASSEVAAQVLAGRFTFLNRATQLGNPPDWSAPGTSRLWRFQLHAFPFAVDLEAAGRAGHADAYVGLRALVRSWSEAHPVGCGDAWHPFVAAGRLLHWLIARDLLQSELEADPSFRAELRSSLLAHATYLDAHLETDVGGNHLLKNLVALYAASAAFDGNRPARWRARAERLLGDELRRQVLPDGGHYERSPMYHLLVLADLLVAQRVAQHLQSPLQAALADVTQAMQTWASAILHPDGDIPLFNDAVLGEAPPPRALGAAPLPAFPPGPRALLSSGYAIMPTARGPLLGILVADCGPPGPPDLPAHVHADALSYELAVGGQRVVVDGGTYDYEARPVRQTLRGTASHNTVEIDGEDQSEVWGTFRVGRRASVRVEVWQAGPEGSRLRASHDGYRRIGARRHERQIDAVPEYGWRVLDTIHGRGDHQNTSRIRLRPGLTWRAESHAWTVIDGAGATVLRVVPIGAAAPRIQRGLYAERFSVLEEVQVLALERSGPLPAVFGYWLLLPGSGEPPIVP